MTEQVLPPPVMWAQRKGLVLVTINLEDVKDPDIKFEKKSVYFKGTGGVEKKIYEATIPLFAEIDPEKSKFWNRGRCIELMLQKADEELPYWQSLTSTKQKLHWIKCDFNKWQDEDDSGDEGVGGMGPGGSGDFEEMMRRMGGLGGGGGGMPGDKPNFDDLDMGGGSEDSDDEEVPDLE